MLAHLPTTKPIRATAPTFEQEPLTIEEARQQCGLAGNGTHDEDLKGWIVAAREQFENDTGLVCYTGSFVWKQTFFPYSDTLDIPDIRPVTAVTSITYVDSSGATQTWSSTSYSPESGNVTPGIRLVYGQYWPTVRGDINGIALTLVAGYANVPLIPQRIKTAVKLLVRLLFLQKMENTQEAERQQQGYDRWITGLQRGTYP